MKNLLAAAPLFTQIPDAVLLDPRITAIDKLILGLVHRLSSFGTKWCTISAQGIGKLAGLSRARAIQRVAALREKGYLQERNRGFRKSRARRVVATQKLYTDAYARGRNLFDMRDMWEAEEVPVAAPMREVPVAAPSHEIPSRDSSVRTTLSGSSSMRSPSAPAREGPRVLPPGGPGQTKRESSAMPDFKDTLANTVETSNKKTATARARKQERKAKRSIYTSADEKLRGTPPETPKNCFDALTAWNTLITEKYPRHPPTFATKKQLRQLKDVLRLIGHDWDLFEKMVQVLIWDFSAVRSTYRLRENMPALDQLFKLRPQLLAAAASGEGVTNASNRRSHAKARGYLGAEAEVFEAIDQPAAEAARDRLVAEFGFYGPSVALDLAEELLEEQLKKGGA